LPGGSDQSGIALSHPVSEPFPTPERGKNRSGTPTGAFFMGIWEKRKQTPIFDPKSIFCPQSWKKSVYLQLEKSGRKFDFQTFCFIFVPE
jgi:hypothetical protein